MTPSWSNKFLAFPDRPGDFNLSSPHHPRWRERLFVFRGQGNKRRKLVYYNDVNLSSIAPINLNSSRRCSGLNSFTSPVVISTASSRTRTPSRFSPLLRWRASTSVSLETSFDTKMKYSASEPSWSLRSERILVDCFPRIMESITPYTSAEAIFSLRSP